MNAEDVQIISTQDNPHKKELPKLSAFLPVSTVKPIPKLYTSVPVAKTGSSVNVTCTAESYPPANTAESYLMRHPRDKDIERVLLPGKDGVVHIISGASLNDSGEYECTVRVTLDEYSTPLQSDNIFTNLTVYGELIANN